MGNEEYVTNNMALAAYLLSNDFVMKDTIKQEGKILFVFEVKFIDKYVDKYFKNDKVQVLTFWNHVKNLKSLVWNKKGG